MKSLLYIIPVLFLTACSKYDGGEPIFPQDIEGEWYNVEHPTRHYIFGDGYATSWDYNFSTVINAHWYEVKQTGERDLMLVEINKGDTLRWRFSPMSGDTSVTVADFTNIPTIYIDLKRD